MTLALHERTAVVTGASRGIGLAVSRALAAQGARVVMLARTADELRTRAQEIGERAHAVPCDVRSADALEQAISAIRARLAGPPDIIVNNAGLFRLAPIEHTTPDQFESTIAVNLAAPFRLVRAFLPELRARGHGHVIAIGSIADHTIFPENGAYAASKYGIRALHEVLRAELRGSGVRVTVVSPAATDTNLWDEISPGRADLPPRSAMLPPEAVASAVVYAATQPPEVDVELIRLARS